MRLCEFETDANWKLHGIELRAWARYRRGDVPTQGERDYIERRVLAKSPNAELVEMRRRFVPCAGGEEPNEVWWCFIWIDFSHKPEGGAL